MFSLICMLLGLLGTLVPLAAAQAGGDARSYPCTGEVVDAIVNDYPPFAFINKRSELDGFDGDVAKAFAAKLGVKLRLETPDWRRSSARGWAGRFDIAITSSTPNLASLE